MNGSDEIELTEQNKQADDFIDEAYDRLKDDLGTEKLENEYAESKLPKNKSRFSKVVKMKYDPFDGVPTGHRRCGNCGEIYKLTEFKNKSKPGYDWKCSDCREYTETYK